MPIKVAGYVKLAKLWEKRRDAALKLHTDYYKQKYDDSSEFHLIGVFIDITGQKSITNRPEMLRLLACCVNGDVDVIAVQTRAYLAANMEEFCYLLHFIFSLERRIDIVTEDPEWNINTIKDTDGEKIALLEMASNYVSLTSDSYERWKMKVINKINLQNGGTT